MMDIQTQKSWNLVVWALWWRSQSTLKLRVFIINSLTQRRGYHAYRQTRRQCHCIQLNKEIGLADPGRSRLCGEVFRSKTSRGRSYDVILCIHSQHWHIDQRIPLSFTWGRLCLSQDLRCWHDCAHVKQYTFPWDFSLSLQISQWPASAMRWHGTYVFTLLVWCLV